MPLVTMHQEGRVVDELACGSEGRQHSLVVGELPRARYVAREVEV